MRSWSNLWGISADGPGASTALIMIQVVLRTTEDMLSLVPWTLREAAFALVHLTTKSLPRLVYRGAATGILTAFSSRLPVSRGKTAPLLVHVIQ